MKTESTHYFSRFSARAIEPKLFSPPSKPKTIYDVPIEIVANMATQLYLLLNLAWDYVDTVNEISRTLGADNTKRAARRIKELRRIYEQRRSRHIDRDHEDKERDLALLFEKLCSPHLTKFHYSLTNDIQRECPAVSEDEKYLIEAVMTALTMVDVAILYGKDCDTKIRQMGVNGNSIITPEISELKTLLPKYIAGQFNPTNQNRKLTARIIYNEVKQVELCEVHNS